MLTHVLMRRILATPNVVTEDVLTESLDWIDHRVDHAVATGRAPAADVIRPPAETRAPTLERLVLHTRVHLDQLGARRCRHRGTWLVRTPTRSGAARASDACRGSRAGRARVCR